jgi:drug/metabolite transporter (DMT)-like permease
VLTHTPFATIPTSAWLWFVYSAVISMGIAYLFWYRGIRVLGPTRTAVYGNLQPFIAILFGWALLGEAPTGWQIVGALTIITGIFLTRA